MGAIAAIAGKEIRIYLTTWVSYVLFAIFILISAFFFQRLVIEYQLQSLEFDRYAKHMLAKMNLTDWVIAPLLQNVVVFFVFMIPILTMRLIAEERSRHTLALLLTSPIRPIEIILGKYLAGIFLMSVMLALTLVFPLLLERLGSASSGGLALDWHSIGTAYLGMFLLGAGFVAIGLFASSITESQIVAVIISFFITLMFIVIGIASRGQNEVWAQIINYISATSHVEYFLRGIVRLQDVVYYISVSFTGVFLSYRVLEAERWR